MPQFPIRSIAVLLSTCAFQATAQTPPPAPASLPFTKIQPELLGVPGSLSNAWGDFDNDSDLDLAVSLKSGEIRLYRNDAGTLVGIGEAMGLPLKGQETRGLSWGDYDGDGWIDLLAGATDPKMLTKVFHNQRGKKFVDVAATIGLTVPGRSARQTSWLDFDNDGDLDLYAADRIGANTLFRNDGGKFTQVFADNGISDRRPTVGACWLDADNDGDLDLFLANQSGATDALWRNDGTTFVDIAPALHMDRPGRTKEEGGVGCAVGDYDNDGLLDIFEPTYGKNALWHNNGDGTFTDRAEKLGVGVENHAVGASWGDYDNDGLIDLSVMSYHGSTPTQVPADSLFHNDGASGFTNVIDANPLLNEGDHGVQWVDYNRDGALDLSVTHGYSAVGGHYVFRNDLPRAVGQRSLSVEVLDAKGRFTRFGSEVRLFNAKTGKIVGTRQVSTGDGYNTQNAAPVHFGLKSTAPVNVEVTFMSKSGPKKQLIRNVTPAAYFGKSLIVKQAK
jgi:hypothetical protein